MLNAFNETKYLNYVSKFSERDKAYIGKIIKNTIFISTNDMIEMVRKSLKRAIEQAPKYNILIPRGKIGSEHFILTQLKNELHPIQVLRNYDIPNNDYPIFILDDAIYSSVHMCGITEEFTYQTKCKNRFYCIVAVLSTFNCQLTEPCFNATIFAELICDNIIITKLFDDYSFDYFYNTFELESQYVIPVFFQHKIANEFGTYTKLYEAIIDNPINRKMIDSITQDDIDRLFV